MKTTKCPTCGGIVFKLTGKAAKLCHDECLDCRTKRSEAEANENHPFQDGDQSGSHDGSRHK
jgi:hypothetical protein